MGLFIDRMREITNNNRSSSYNRFKKRIYSDIEDTAAAGNNVHIIFPALLMNRIGKSCIDYLNEVIEDLRQEGFHIEIHKYEIDTNVVDQIDINW